MSSHSKHINTVLLASGWKDDLYTLTLPSVRANSNGFVGPAEACSAEEEAALAGAEIVIAVQYDGLLVLKARGAVPQIDLPVSVMVLDADSTVIDPVPLRATKAGTYQAAAGMAYQPVFVEDTEAKEMLSNVGDAILNTMKHIAYADEDGETYYNDVADAYGKEAYSAGPGNEGIGQ